MDEKTAAVLRRFQRIHRTPGIVSSPMKKINKEPLETVADHQNNEPIVRTEMASPEPEGEQPHQEREMSIEVSIIFRGFGVVSLILALALVYGMSQDTTLYYVEVPALIFTVLCAYYLLVTNVRTIAEHW